MVAATRNVPVADACVCVSLVFECACAHVCCVVRDRHNAPPAPPADAG